jgi:membrane-associated protease RseP (regulator of RpoE activity)
MKNKTILYLGLFMASLLGLNSISHAGDEDKTYTFLGVETSALSDTTREQLDIKGMGLVVENVIEETAAEEAGLMNGDILIKLGDQRLINSDQLGSLIRSQEPGDTIQLQILRKGETLNLKVKLGETSNKARKEFSSSRAFLGVESHKVSKVLANQLDLPDDVGITITRVVENSGAEDAGMKKNDILVSIDGENISDSNHLGKVLRKHKAGEEISVNVLRKGKEQTLMVTLGERKEVEYEKRFSWFGDAPEAPEEMEFHFEALQDRLAEVQEQASEIGQQIMEHIPEIVIQKEGKDGSQRTTVIKMSERSVITTTDNIKAKMITKNGEKMLTVTNNDGDVLYEGGEPSDEELEALPDDVKEIIFSLLNNESLSLETLKDIDGKNVKVIIHTTEDETSIESINTQGG